MQEKKKTNFQKIQMFQNLVLRKLSNGTHHVSNKPCIPTEKLIKLVTEQTFSIKDSITV